MWLLPPHLFHIYGPISINSYGLFIVLGLAVFAALLYQDENRKKLVDDDRLADLFLVGIGAGLAGGRMFYFLVHPSSFDSYTEIFLPWVSGFSVVGSFISIPIALWYFLSKKRIPPLPFFDVVSIYIPLLQSIARLGCLCAGCCYGAPCSSPFWGIIFVHPESFAPLNIPLHPTQLYSSVASLFIFFFLFFFLKKQQPRTGTLFFSYLLMESAARFLVDFLRWEHPWHSCPSFSLSFYQWTCIIIFISALLNLYIVTFTNKPATSLQ